MKRVNWYFDFISPFAYLQSAIIYKITGQIFVDPKPILFAGLLNHYGHLGPAEIVPKRRFIFEQSLWLAKKYNVKMVLPPHHPFNPLPPLRLSIACECNLDKICEIFDFIWKEGRDVDNEIEFNALGKRLGIVQVKNTISDELIKEKLKTLTTEAISEGVFGIPTIVFKEQLFWGIDSTDFLLDFLDSPEQVKADIIEPVANFKVGKAKRKR